MTASAVLSTGLADSQTEVIAHWAATAKQQIVWLNLIVLILEVYFDTLN